MQAGGHMSKDIETVASTRRLETRDRRGLVA